MYHPTLVSFAVDVTKVDNIISPEFKAAGNTVVYLPMKRDKLLSAGLSVP